jgi:hypothetical protein
VSRKLLASTSARSSAIKVLTIANRYFWALHSRGLNNVAAKDQLTRNVL